MSDQEFLSGRLLVAMPGIGDPRFERAIIYVCSHDEEQAMGLTLNRPVDGLDLVELLDKLEVQGADAARHDPVLMGGPVQSERGFVLHTDDYEGPGGSVVLGGGLALTATRDVLEAMTSRERGPRRAILALGFAGWGPGQLEDELKQNVWLICDPDEDLIFDDDHAAKWGRALAKLGVSAGALSGQAGSA
jgi:putative transcriptional regulator